MYNPFRIVTLLCFSICTLTPSSPDGFNIKWHSKNWTAPVDIDLADDGTMYAAEAGANNITHILVPLNGDIAIISRDWLMKNYPNKYQRVLHQIENCHGGNSM